MPETIKIRKSSDLDWASIEVLENHLPLEDGVLYNAEIYAPTMPADTLISELERVLVKGGFCTITTWDLAKPEVITSLLTAISNNKNLMSSGGFHVTLYKPMDVAKSADPIIPPPVVVQPPAASIDITKGEEVSFAKSFDVPFFKKSEDGAEPSTFYYIAYEPRVLDNDNPRYYTDEATLEDACKSLDVANVKFDERHNGLSLRGVKCVENFIAKSDMEFYRPDGKPQRVRKGSWLLGINADENPTIKQKLIKGEYTGISIEGKGIAVPGKMEELAA